MAANPFSETNEHVSFMVDQLAWFVDELNFAMNNIPKFIDFFEDECVTLRQYNQMKKIQQGFEEKIKQLNDMNTKLRQLIEETEPYREPLKVV